MAKKLSWAFLDSPYAVYVLLILLGAFIINQMNRYILSVVVIPMQDEIGFGDGKGGGSEYSLLVGPIFTLPYCAAIIPFGYIADRMNKVKLLAFMCIWWTGMITLMAFATQYWHLVVTRMLLGIAQCATICTGIISDYFPLESRGTALGIFNWGIPLGLALVYGLGNFLTDEIGFRWTMVWQGTPIGLILAVLIYVTIKEIGHVKKDPLKNAIVFNEETEKSRLVSDNETNGLTVSGNETTSTENPEAPKSEVKVLKKMSIKESTMYLLRNRTLLLLTLGGCFRMTSGIIWIYYQNVFFETHHGMTQSEIAVWGSWIPVVSGTTGAFMGGFMSDRWSRNQGAAGRVLVLALTSLICVPIQALAIYLPVPYAFIFVLFDGFLSTMFIPCSYAVIVHIVPAVIRVSAISAFLFITTLTGGNATVLEPPLRSIFSGYSNSLQLSLAVLYTGTTLIGGLVYLMTYYSQRREQDQLKENEQKINDGIASTLWTQARKSTFPLRHVR